MPSKELGVLLVVQPAQPTGEGGWGASSAQDIKRRSADRHGLGRLSMGHRAVCGGALVVEVEAVVEVDSESG